MRVPQLASAAAGDHSGLQLSDRAGSAGPSPLPRPNVAYAAVLPPKFSSSPLVAKFVTSTNFQSAAEPICGDCGLAGTLLSAEATIARMRPSGVPHSGVACRLLSTGTASSRC